MLFAPHSRRAGTQHDTPTQREITSLQLQISKTSKQLAEAVISQHQYVELVEQLKLDQAESDLELDRLNAELQVQQEHVSKVGAQLVPADIMPVQQCSAHAHICFNNLCLQEWEQQ